MYACKQPWLDYSLLFCPEAKPDDGKLWLVIQDSNFGHRDGAHWMFNGDRVGSRSFDIIIDILHLP